MCFRSLPICSEFRARCLMPGLTCLLQQRKALLFRTFLARLDGLAARGPVLMVLEDAHWLDPTSRELFDQIVDRLQSLPVLLVATFRLEVSPPWIGFPHVTLLTFNRLATGAGGCAGRADHRGQGASHRGPRPDPGAHRGCAAFRRRAHEGSAGSRDSSSAQAIAYVLAGPLPSVRDPGDAARFADGAARPSRAGEGGGPDRSLYRSRIRS